MKADVETSSCSRVTTELDFWEDEKLCQAGMPKHRLFQKNSKHGGSTVGQSHIFQNIYIYIYAYTYIRIPICVRFDDELSFPHEGRIEHFPFFLSFFHVCIHSSICSSFCMYTSEFIKKRHTSYEPSVTLDQALASVPFVVSEA